ncbi:plasmid mobilization protein [Anaerotalea alkaliphila]|uniref:Ribbon-helix-helix protein, CopG family n=1 Tax=Anaerotalea alkaliphila TaxID=2662126 RepID=A0A7X5HWP7_9FIRM|nr:ribbon-helix-helix protein, CopG family [Anaerotalea alkaliphila]NDL68001.1 ribbon-helix-helix protein, CopG family [Anaerotalea alkaliphila]
MDKIGKYEVNETDTGKLLVKGKSLPIQQEVPVPEGELMTINGAWNLDQIPTQYIVERVDGTLAMFSVTPFRRITEADLKPYKGYHPRMAKGSPMPEYLYKFYSFARNEETLSEVIRVRMSPSEKEKLDAAARNAGKNVSEFIRDFVRGL